VDDIEEVISRADHYRFEEPQELNLLNRISDLPSSKKRMKKSIIERIELLVGAYISLATFVSDEEVDFLIVHYGTEDKKELKEISRIYQKVADDIRVLETEIREAIQKI
jgi:hypothetical protein